MLERSEGIAPLEGSQAPDPAALARRDEQAWNTLLETQGPRLLAVARRLLRDEDAARDRLQVAFVQALALSLSLRDEPLLADIPRGLLRAIAGGIERET